MQNKIRHWLKMGLLSGTLPCSWLVCATSDLCAKNNLPHLTTKLKATQHDWEKLLCRLNRTNHVGLTLVHYIRLRAYLTVRLLVCTFYEQ